MPSTRFGIARRAAKDLGPVAGQPLDVLRVPWMRERMVQLRVLKAPLVVSSGESQESRLAAGEVEHRRARHVNYSLIPLPRCTRPAATRPCRPHSRPCPPAIAGGHVSEMNSGDDLLSQGVSPQVPSAQAGLTSVFGMGTGVTLPLWPPETFRSSGVGACSSRSTRRWPALPALPLEGRCRQLPLEPSIASTSSKPSAD